MGRAVLAGRAGMITSFTFYVALVGGAWRPDKPAPDRYIVCFVAKHFPSSIYALFSPSLPCTLLLEREGWVMRSHMRTGVKAQP